MSSSLPNMSSTMLRMAASTEVQRAEMTGSIEVHSLDAPVDDLDPAAVFKLALARCEIDQKRAAIEMEMDESLLSRQLRGDGNMPMRQAAAKLPRRFWIEYVALLGQRLGMRVEHFSLEEQAVMQAGDLLQALARVMAQSRGLRRAG
jgi:hypothetical protein